jgi:hypothetical protein
MTRDRKAGVSVGPLWAVRPYIRDGISPSMTISYVFLCCFGKATHASGSSYARRYRQVRDRD